ncbi:MAG: hypothetical protein NUV59_01085 [Patescibacteria group bacterium]|nr:hypothetical protein [Patescibacteria group bacterium]
MDREPLRHNSKSRYRDTFLVGPDKDHVAKTPKTSIEKKYSLGTVHYPSSAYTLLKFGKTNINEVDYENYKALPSTVREQFAASTRIIQGVIVQERVMNFDGAPSLSVEEETREHGRIENTSFWEKIDELRRVFLAEERPLLGVFHRGSNILVRKASAEEWLPVIVDFKRLGARSYPLQPNLILRDELRKKFLRQFEAFEKEYKPEGV